MRKALYPGKTRWPKAAHLEGSGEGNEKFPSPSFLSAISFREKKWCPRRGGGPAGPEVYSIAFNSSARARSASGEG